MTTSDHLHVAPAHVPQSPQAAKAGSRFPARPRILVDLKPALDGYSGIPQEARLLFRGLCGLDHLETEGLLQHGGRRLREALSTKHDRLTPDRRINVLSRFVVSLFQEPHASGWQSIRALLARHAAQQIVQGKGVLSINLRMSRFESTLFDDFTWRMLFSKTLNASDRQLLAGRTYRVLAEPRHAMHGAGMGALGTYATVDTRDFDYFIAQTPFPGRVSTGTQLMVRYHDAVPVLMPHTISDKAFHQASHYRALRDNVRSGAWFLCISHASRADLLKIFPEAEQRSCVIPNIVSDEYHAAPSPVATVAQIVRNRAARVDEKVDPASFPFQPDATSKPVRYLLMVSTIEPRKNHQLLMQAWEALRYGDHPDLKLLLVGNRGWDDLPILKLFRPWALRGDLFWLNDVPAAELRVLYQHAAVTVCPGLAEGFDYSGVEAMKCAGLVAASDIPVHREVYRDAAAYFDAYDAGHAAAILQRLLACDNDAQSAALRSAGAKVAASYSSSSVMPLWVEFFESLESARKHGSAPLPQTP